MLSRGLTVAVLLGLVLLSVGCGENLTDAQHVDRAREFQEKGQLRSSIIELKNALQKNPANLEARSLLGKIYVEVGDGVSAEKELRGVLNQGMVIEAVAAPLAQSLLLQGKFADLLALNVNTSQVNADTKATLFALYGRAYLAQGKLNEATEQFQSALKAKADSPATLLGQALLAAQRQQWDEARRWTEQVLAVDPKSAEAWSLKGGLDYQAGEYGTAEAAYTKAIENRFNKRQDLLKRAWARIHLKNYEGAQKDIDTIKQASTRYPGSSYAQGRIYFEQRRFAEAQTAFEQELNIYSDHLEALYYLGLTHLAQNHAKQAEDYLKRLAGLTPQSDQVTKLLAEVHLRNKEPAKAAAVLQEVIKRTPNDPEAIQLMGRSRVAQGDTDKGVDYLKKAANLQPDVAGAHLQLGLGLLEKGAQAEGIRELQKAAELDPKLRAADVALIMNYLRTQAFDKALEAASRLVEKQPADPLSHTLLGIVYQQQGKVQPARTEFEQALKLNPDFSMAANGLAQVDAIAGNPAAAENRYRQVLEKNPTNLQALLGLAELARQSGQSRQAVEWLEKVRQYHPDYWQAGLILVQTYLDRKENQQALELARNLLNANPTNPAVLRGFGLTLLANGQSADAQASFRRLIDLQPKSAEAWYWLAQTQLQANDPQAAAGSLDKALALQPNNLPSLVARTDLQLRNQQFDEALTGARNIQAQYPDQTIGFKLEGDIYLQQQDFAKATAAYRKAYEKAPGGQAVLQLSNAQWSGGKGEEAVTTLREWLVAHPQDTQVRTQLANYLRGLGRQVEATAEYEKLVERKAADTGQPGKPAKEEQSVLQADILLNQSYLQQKEFDKAITAASELSKKLPNDPVPYNLLGAAYLAKGDTKQARQAFEQALKRDSNSTTARLNLAELNLQAGDKAAAEALYRQILERDKGNLAAQIKLADLANQTGRSEDAVHWLEQAVETNPQALEPRLLLGDYYVRIGKPAQAWPVFQKAQELNPNDVRVGIALGNAQLAAGQPEDAVATFRKVVATQSTAQTHYLLARAYSALNDNSRVRAELETALKLDPKHALANIALIRQVAQENKPEEANKLWQELNQAYPQNPEVIALGGELALRQNRPQEAEEAFKAALKLAPSEQVTVSLAQAQWQAGKKEDSITTLESWLQQNPNNVPVRLRMGILSMQLGHNDQAKAAFAKVIEQAPRNALALNNLAWLLSRENPNEALKYAERALEADPNSPDAKDTLGMLLLEREGQLGRAVDLLKDAAAKAPNNLSTQYHLALALARSGDKEQARKLLTDLLASQPAFPEKMEAEALLQSLGN